MHSIGQINSMIMLLWRKSQNVCESSQKTHRADGGLREEVRGETLLLWRLGPQFLSAPVLSNPNYSFTPTSTPIFPHPSFNPPLSPTPTPGFPNPNFPQLQPQLGLRKKVPRFNTNPSFPQPCPQFLQLQRNPNSNRTHLTHI